jgi:hypothetical protein
MFEGTDLNMAFGSVYEQPAHPVQQMAPPPPPAPPAMDLPLPKSTASHQTPPDMPYPNAPATYAQQGGKPVTVDYSDSFVDKLGRKKWEVVKLIILALVILLGISLDKVANHYLTAYISKSFLTDTQEFLVRIGYPVSIVLVLWIIKAMM